MTSDVEKYILDIAERTSEKLGVPFALSTVRWIDRPAGKSEVVDSTLAFFIDGKSRKDDVVLIVSNPRFPNVVREANERAASIARHLEEHTRRHISVPIIEGSYGGQSYAIYPRLEGLAQNRGLRYLQKQLLAPRIAGWLESLALQTKQVCSDLHRQEEAFLKPLLYLSQEEEMHHEIREFSNYCLEKISNEGCNLWTSAEHGDFWYGNVLFSRSHLPNLGAFQGSFFVIDWAGARLDGYPGIDVVRYSLSTSGNSNRAARMVDDYATRTGMSSFELGLHCVSALGFGGLNRNNFPKHRYLALCVDVFSFLHQNRFASDKA